LNKPPWLVVKVKHKNKITQIKKILDDSNLHTVCEEALCPNIGECWNKKSVTFMILGDICTRNCSFCAVGKGKPKPPDLMEPSNIANMVQKLNLNHVVITSVDRDDLEDNGASHFVNTVNNIKTANPNTTIEVLIPDFIGYHNGINQVVESKPDIINHNIETISRLHSKVKPKSNYLHSLNLLKTTKKLNNKIFTKSGIILGLGETKTEIINLMNDLLSVNCDILTIGQYLQPSYKHPEVVEYVPPKQFNEYKKIGESLGFKFVASGPFVRSSYYASEVYDIIKTNNS